MRAVSTVASGLRHSAVAVAEALIVAAIIAGLLLALSPVYQPADFLAGTESAQAAKGGRAASRAAAGLTSSCNPCTAGSVVQFTGSGFDPSEAKAILNLAGAWTATAVYGDGSVAFDWPYFQMPGAYTVTAYQHQGQRLVAVASVTVTVQ